MRGVADGSLELICGPDSAGKPTLRRQFCEPPFHVGKGYREGNRLTVQVANPSAGIFSGDSLKVRIQVIKGTHLVVKTPAATSLYPGTGTAIVEQQLEASGGSTLEWLPEPLIPYAGARLQQRLAINVQQGSRFLGAEIVAPGRVARDEVFAYDFLEFRTRFTLDGKVIVQDRFELRPQKNHWITRRKNWNVTFFATIWQVEEKDRSGSCSYPELETMQTRHLQIGCTRVHPLINVIRVASCDGVEMRKVVRAVLSHLRQTL